MSVDTTLRISSEWSLYEIANALKVATARETSIQVVDSKGLEDCAYINVGERQLFVSRHSVTPIGDCTYISLHSNDDAHFILKSLAKIIGGIYQENDYEDKYELINGEISEENGLPYFIKYAIIHDGIKHDDIDGLLTSMNKWYEKCDNGNKPEFLKRYFSNIKET